MCVWQDVICSLSQGLLLVHSLSPIIICRRVIIVKHTEMGISE